MLRKMRSTRVAAIDDRTGSYVFTNAIGEPVHPQDVTDDFREVVRAAGIPLSDSTISGTSTRRRCSTQATLPSTWHDGSATPAQARQPTPMATA